MAVGERLAARAAQLARRARHALLPQLRLHVAVLDISCKNMQVGEVNEKFSLSTKRRRYEIIPGIDYSRREYELQLRVNFLYTYP